MAEIKHYLDIQNFSQKYLRAFNEGDHILITEKIDGSNLSVSYDPETDSLVGFSRKNPLSPQLPLDGAYEYIQRLDKEAFKKYEGYRLFGEWGLKHLVKYKPEHKNQMWAFDVWDLKNECWMPQEFAQKMARDCNINYVPIFYDGPFISIEHLMSFMGKSDMTIEPNTGEGVVIKNQTTINNPSSRTPFELKFVAPAYSEKAQKSHVKEIDPEKLAAYEANMALAKTIVTYNRIEKIIYKMIVEEQIIPRDWDSSHMKTIAKELPRRVYDDCVKEEEEIVFSVPSFGSFCAKISMSLAKQMLSEKESI